MPRHFSAGGFRLAWVFCAFCAHAAPAPAQTLTPLAARLTDPTDRYPHNVLGHLRGFAALEADLPGGAMARLTLPETRVFEDVAPRLWDVDGDGRAEVVVVESDRDLGARLTAWTVRGEAVGAPELVLRAAGDFIGRRFRWLALAGIADFTGDGRPEIALVEMPHLARRLVLVGLRGARFEPLAQLDGVSNHRIGEAFITGGLRDCGAGPELLLPAADWRRVLRITFDGSRLVARDHGAFTGTGALATMLTCPG